MMHPIVRLLFLLLLLAAYGPAYSIDKNDKKKQKLIVPGRWREVVRKNPDSTVVAFNDTLFIHFMPKDSFSYHYRNGFIYEGVYLLSEDSILNFGTASFKVLRRKGDSMVMTNNKGIFYFSIDKSDTLKAIVIKREDSTRPVNNIDVMIGRWSVYKRTAEGPGTIDPSENIRSAYITGPSSDGKQGFVYSGSDPDNVPSWHITELGGGQSLNLGGKNNRTLKVVRCQDGEMILEEKGIKYYFTLYR